MSWFREKERGEIKRKEMTDKKKKNLEIWMIITLHI